MRFLPPSIRGHWRRWPMMVVLSTPRFLDHGPYSFMLHLLVELNLLEGEYHIFSFKDPDVANFNNVLGYFAGICHPESADILAVLLLEILQMRWLRITLPLIFRFSALNNILADLCITCLSILNPYAHTWRIHILPLNRLLFSHWWWWLHAQDRSVRHQHYLWWWGRMSESGNWAIIFWLSLFFLVLGILIYLSRLRGQDVLIDLVGDLISIVYGHLKHGSCNTPIIWLYSRNLQFWFREHLHRPKSNKYVNLLFEFKNISKNKH